MKKIYLYMMLLCLGLAACEKEPGRADETSDDTLHEISYGISRALGENRPAAPTEGTAYTMMSYLYNNTDNPNIADEILQDVGNYHFNPSAAGGRPIGYYAYMSASEYLDVLQPCYLSADRRNSAGRHAPNGQGLKNGHYMTVCVHPAMNLQDNGGGSDRILFQRKDERLASNPFHINVRGYQLFDLPEPYDDGNTIPIHDIRSKVWLDVIQGGPYSFTISDLKLVNAGCWGWYHPLLERTAVSYEEGNEFNGSNEFYETTTDTKDPKAGRYNIYDKDLNPTTGNQENLVQQTGAAPTDGSGQADVVYGPATYGEGNVIYTTGRGVEQGLFFFANDYTTETLLQPGLSLKLTMSGSEFNIVIPLKINMKANHAYLFRLTVESSAIRVHFKPVNWYTGGDLNENVGEGSDYIYLGTWNVKGWEQGNSNDPMDIG